MANAILTCHKQHAPLLSEVEVEGRIAQVRRVEQGMAEQCPMLLVARAVRIGVQF